MKMEKALELKKVKRIEITTLADNYTDVFLSSTETVKRDPIIAEGQVTRGLLAEHGISLLVDVFSDLDHHQILFDAGWFGITVSFNLETLGTNLDNVEAVVLSHGHVDHFGGLLGLYRDRLIPRDAPLIVHPDVFHQRYLEVAGQLGRFPQLTRAPFNHLGVKIQENKTPLLLGADSVLVTGEVERVTDFEKGFPAGRKLEEGKIKPDIAVMDEQAIVLNVEGKGLVILTGCGHQGIINTITYAQKLTQEIRVYFVMGGLHLTGPLFEPLIDRTIAEMKKFSPRVVVPTHCSGWKAINAFAREMPNAFVLNSVGAKYLL
jgi:7,8-dihydropterin-6-yl-methyl-4-(beta-D-ribofuranosyl)aminobenzene 5'-phosphate synthase